MPVLVGLDRTATYARITAGQSVCPPILVRGLLDTGANMTGVAAGVLQRLGLVPVIGGITQTASGLAPVDLFKVSLSITDPVQISSPWLTQPDLFVMELAADLSDDDVLIGLDILLGCKLILDGPARHFSLEF